MNRKGLTSPGLKVFEGIKKSDLLQEYILIGGTALSLQINNRLSEDLDFCK
jgi:predicted nucleotidyltransferase component of viral defense system